MPRYDITINESYTSWQYATTTVTASSRDEAIEIARSLYNNGALDDWDWADSDNYTLDSIEIDREGSDEELPPPLKQLIHTRNLS